MQTAEISDALLVQRVRKGSEEAWTALYQRHRVAVFRFALHMSGSREIADEAVQDTFITFLDRLAEFQEDRGAPIAFLIGIARFKVLRILRQRKQTIPLNEVPERPFEGDALTDLTREESRYALQRAIAALPESYREAVVLCDLRELSYEDAAKVMECPVGTVRSRLHRARQMLIERMTAKGKGCLA